MVLNLNPCMIYITKYCVTNTWGFITLILHMCSWQLSNQQILRLFHDRNSSFGPATVHNTYTLLLVQTLITQFTLHSMASHLLIHSFSILNKWLGITWCKQISTKHKYISVFHHLHAISRLYILVQCQVELKCFTRHIKFDPQVMWVALQTTTE